MTIPPVTGGMGVTYLTFSYLTFMRRVLVESSLTTRRVLVDCTPKRSAELSVFPSGWCWKFTRRKSVNFLVTCKTPHKNVRSVVESGGNDMLQSVEFLDRIVTILDGNRGIPVEESGLHTRTVGTQTAIVVSLRDAVDERQLLNGG